MYEKASISILILAIIFAGATEGNPQNGCFSFCFNEITDKYDCCDVQSTGNTGNTGTAGNTGNTVNRVNTRTGSGTAGNTVNTVNTKSGSGTAGKPNIPCDRNKCPWITMSHYYAMGCETRYDSGSCCPTSFVCKTERERGLRSDKCYYHGRAYNVRDKIPITYACEANCYCRGGDLAEIVCAQVECPTSFNGREPGCLYQFSHDKCCSTKKLCGVSALRRLTDIGTCSADGRTYQIGEKMYFKSHPCQKCICTKDYTGPTGPQCQKVDCGFDHRYRSRLAKNCVPIYSSCCFYDWMCPNDERINKGQQPIIDDNKPFCSIGDIKVNLGDYLRQTNVKAICRCEVPPLLTCIYFSALSSS